MSLIDVAQSVLNVVGPLMGAGALFNSTLADSNSTSSDAGSRTPITDIGSLLNAILSLAALRDWIKIFIIGGFLETCRRLFFWIWENGTESFFIDASFREDDSAYNWMILWLSKQPTWKKARRIEVSTNYNPAQSQLGINADDDDPDSDKLLFMPSVSNTYTIWYKGRWIRVSRTTIQGNYQRIESWINIRIMTRNHQYLADILKEARRMYREEQKHNISIYVSTSSNEWRHVASRPKRPLKSIVLDPGMKDLLVDDAKDFLESKQWYADRGIPFRRGYLLYGAPGSGKTSMIHSLAGELGLDVYIVSLSRSGLDDTGLNELISDLPEQCIALMEDIDAAFNTGLKRDLEKDTTDDNADTSKTDSTNNNNSNNSTAGPRESASKITLSGLLNALDGVGAQEGRLLYATTNNYSVLDPALVRAGRMDLHVEFKLASRYQAAELFQCFYLPDKEKSDTNEAAVTEKKGTSTEKTPTTNGNGAVTEKFEFYGSSHKIKAPRLSKAEIGALAAEFASTLPEREFSMASLQGYLMAYKTRPKEAVDEITKWIEKERAEKLSKKTPKAAIA